MLAALRTRYARDKGWALFTEVTTGQTNRRADAVAVNLWTNSRDHQVHGIEVKVARSDWLAELKNPEKSAYFRDRCAYWWIAAGPGVVRVEELPANWGLLVLAGSVLRMERSATALDGSGLDVDLMVVLARHAFDASPSKDLLAAERQAAKDEERRYQENRQAENGKWQQRNLDADYADWQAMKRDFEKASGVHLSAASAKVAGQAYRLVYESKDRERDALTEIRSAKERIRFLFERFERLEAEARKTFGLNGTEANA